MIKKILKTILKVIGIILLIIIILILGVIAVAKYRGDHYYNYTKTEQPIEEKYTAMGGFEVSYQEEDAADEQIQKYEVWYPKELSESDTKYPVVLVANGTGIKASANKAFFKHMASWGFIVIGNEDENTRTGESAEKTLCYILAQNKDKESIFYQKVDEDNIGICGHSQGGVAVYNAATVQEHGYMYKALCTISATSPYWGQEDVFGTEWSYDLSNIQAPVLMTAGTGYFDAGEAQDIEPHEGQGICPLWSLEANYIVIPEDVPKLAIRKTDIDHGATNTETDGYTTAWFVWLLQNDEDAGAAFIGENAEILHNSLYQDGISNIR